MNDPQPQIRLPSPPERYDRGWMARLLDEITKNLDRRLSKEAANSAILMQSTGGKIFEVTVDDGGVLKTRYVQG